MEITLGKKQSPAQFIKKIFLLMVFVLSLEALSTEARGSKLKPFLFGFFSSFFKKDCPSLYKKYSKKLLLSSAVLSPREGEQIIKVLETCSKEEELWPFVDLLLRKEDSLQKLPFRQKELEKRVAKIAFYKWKNYEKAIKYYSQLLKRTLEPGEKFLFQYQIASSYLKLEKSSQALIENKKSLFKGITKEERKKALLLQLEIFIVQREFLLAENLIKKLLKNFKKDQVFLRETLATLYESQDKLLLAIEELKKIQDENDFIKIKIKQLEERLENQP